MKKYLIITVAVTILILIFALWPNTRDPEIDRLYRLCDNIEIGMTNGQVLDIMGAPKEKHFVYSDTMTIEYWIYLSSARMSTPVRCDFDSTTQKVIMVLCGEYSRKIRR